MRRVSEGEAPVRHGLALLVGEGVDGYSHLAGGSLGKGDMKVYEEK